MNTTYNKKIQSVANDLISLLLVAKNIEKFSDLDNVLEVIEELICLGIIEKEKMPTIDIPCIGILWNTLNDELKKEAIDMIGLSSTINECIYVNLEDKYQDFINDIYYYNDEFEGIPYFKASALIDKYDSNTIVILNLIIRVSNYIYYNKMKGYLFKEISDLKQLVRKKFKKRILNYGYDTVFHLTVDDGEYGYTDSVCKKYVKGYKGIDNNGK